MLDYARKPFVDTNYRDLIQSIPEKAVYNLQGQYGITEKQAEFKRPYIEQDYRKMKERHTAKIPYLPEGAEYDTVEIIPAAAATENIPEDELEVPELEIEGWLSGWANRIKLTISNTNVDAALFDFPILVYLSTSSGIGNVDVSEVFDELTQDANRKKIAITTSDGETECYVEIERWDDANEKAWLWVKVPYILAYTGTELYLYYDKDHIDNTTYVGDTTDAVTHNVWDANFKGVWHMAQDPNGDATDAIKDSTSPAYEGTPSGTMLTEDLVDGQIGKGIDFDGGDDRLNFGNILPATSDLTISAIIKTLDVALDFQCIMAKVSGTTMNYGFYLKGDEVHFQFYTGGWKTHTSTTANLSPGTLYDVAVIFDVQNDSVKLYVDGVEKYSAAETTDPTSNTHPTYIAHDSGAEWFIGGLDEIRFSDSVRSAAWIKATYYSNWDTIVTFGEEEFPIEAEIIVRPDYMLAEPAPTYPAWFPWPIPGKLYPITRRTF